jgi:hypothetical protein
LISFYPDLPKAGMGVFDPTFPIKWEALPQIVQTAISSLVVALALVSVFFIGLLLDLIGSISVQYEIRIFRKHLEGNQPWILELLDKAFGEYAHRDLDRFSAVFVWIWAFWRKSAWRTFIQGSVRDLGSWRSLTTFRRLECLLIAYALDTQAGAAIAWLDEQLRICRLSRAVSVILFILAMEILVLAIDRPAGISLFVAWFGLAISFFVTWRSYSRFLHDTLLDHLR